MVTTSAIFHLQVADAGQYDASNPLQHMFWIRSLFECYVAQVPAVHLVCVLMLQGVAGETLMLGLACQGFSNLMRRCGELGHCSTAGKCRVGGIPVCSAVDVA